MNIKVVTFTVSEKSIFTPVDYSESTVLHFMGNSIVTCTNRPLAGYGLPPPQGGIL